MAIPAVTEDTLLPYEWPGSYFIGEEEIDAVTKVLLAKSPYRFYGHDLQHYADQVEDFYRERNTVSSLLIKLGDKTAPPVAATKISTAHFDISRPAVSQHLTVLKEAGLLSERRDGTRRLYRARPEAFMELKSFLEEFSAA